MELNDMKLGEVGVYIDTLTPCLKDSITGEIIETEVIRIRRKSFLKKFNSNTGWYVNWSQMPAAVEVYGLVVKGTVDIQGLVGIINDTEAESAYLYWACTAPQNNVLKYGFRKYTGVGGHLFAIAVDKSYEWGNNGLLYGYASSQEVLNHYVSALGVTYVGIRHPLQFLVDEDAAAKIKEVYTYEWTDEEI